MQTEVFTTTSSAIEVVRLNLCKLSISLYKFTLIVHFTIEVLNSDVEKQLFSLVLLLGRRSGG